MPILTDSDGAGAANDAGRHAAAVASLATELDRPIDEIEALYEDELERMRPQASIQDFLSILVSKRVRQTCRHR
ncbi:MAG TPA: DUF3562 domain-containing protein [Noviherbaspirillum sp.]|nr:DUF3562 domain-containing protein [Noviherbaspirillum sp.]